MRLNGFVFMHRSIIDWEWYKDIPVRVLFEHLIYIASFKDSNWKGIDVKRGQAIVGRKNLAEDTGLSERQVRTALKKLQSTGEIAIKPTNKFSLITVVNYDFYQSELLTVTNKMTSNRPTSGQQMTSNRPHLNNDNNLIMEERKKDSQTAHSFSSSTPEPIPRSVEEVQQYCERMGYKIDAARFFYYYSGHGWKTGNEPIMDWHALVKHWNETQRESTEPVQEQPTRVDQETKADSLSHELWSVYSDLSEDGEIEYNPIPPTSLEEVLEYCAGYSGHSQYAEEFYLYFKDKGWKVSEWIIRDWKLAFQIWAQLKEQNLNDQEIVIRMRQNRFSSLDSMFFCTVEERNKIKKKIDWRVKAAR